MFSSTKNVFVFQSPLKVTGGLTVEQEAALLVGQPPGTVIKAITAQVIQTPQGPRIVLQGLTGADFTPQQLALVQHQVKQQLLKGQSNYKYLFNCFHFHSYFPTSNLRAIIT